MTNLNQLQFIRVAAVSPKLKVGDVIFNLEEIKNCLKKLSSKEVNIAVFPELTLSSYSCGDIFFQPILLKACLSALKELKDFSKTINCSFIVGLPLEYKDRIYNCAAFVSQGKVAGIVPKIYIPNTQEYYEKRWFSSGYGLSGMINLESDTLPFGADLIFASTTTPEFTVGIEICEDLWSPLPPSSNLSLAGALIIANLSASSAIIGKTAYRKMLVKSQSGRGVSAYIYAGASNVESSSENLFDSHLLICENGKTLTENYEFQLENKLIYSDIDLGLLKQERLKNTAWQSHIPDKNFRFTAFKEGMKYASINDITYKLLKKYPFLPDKENNEENTYQTILNIASYALSKRVLHTKIKSLVIGVSGGLDSSLALLIAIESVKICLKQDIKILAVSMPGFGTSNQTLNNIKLLTQALETESLVIDIKEAVKNMMQSLEHPLSGVPFENAQARQRTQILMELANINEGIMVGTSDLSEIALGWSTYNGDQTSMYHVCAGIPKTLVKFLLDYIQKNTTNTKLKIALENIVRTPISPELANSGDIEKITELSEEILGPYELHDFFLFHMLNNGFSPTKIYALAGQIFDYPKSKILQSLKVFYTRFFRYQFKRSNMPEAPKIIPITLSPRADFRMPSDFMGSLWEEELKKLE